MTAAGTQTDSYYGRPVLKEPVWKPEIPFYFWVGGLGGASATFGALARAAGHERLARRSFYVAALADAAGPPLLIADLGRPERFLNMFRVFKLTSPLSVGSWILFAGGTASGVGALCEALGILRPVRDAAHALAALLGPAQATYTAVLVSDTAIPAWHEARHELPFVFGASALGTAGAAAALVVPREDAGPARRVALGAALVETVASAVMQARLGLVGEPYRKGAAGLLGAVSKACTLAGAALLARRGASSRAATVAGSALVLAGGLALRWQVFRAGFQSARDPKYTIRPQRERKTARAKHVP